MNKCILALFAFGAASLTSFAAFKTKESLALRYVPAQEAYDAVKEKFGADVSTAIGVDVPSNALTLDPLHAQAPKVREFLAKFDRRSPQILVQATITRHIEATKTEPARDVVISRPTLVTREGQPCVIKIPGKDGETSVELRIEPAPSTK